MVIVSCILKIDENAIKTIVVGKECGETFPFFIAIKLSIMDQDQDKQQKNMAQVKYFLDWQFKQVQLF